MPICTVVLSANPLDDASYAWNEAKDPLSTVERRIDFTPILGDRTITDIVRKADGIVVAGHSRTGSMVTLLLRGGTHGIAGKVQFQVFFDDGTDAAIAVTQPVASVLTLSGFAAAQPEFLTFNGELLTLNGRPLIFGRTPPAG